MTWVAVAVGGSAVVGSYIGSKGAESAAETSADAANQSAQLQYEQYLQSRQDQSPYRDVAVGEEIYGEFDQFGYDKAMGAWHTSGQQGLMPKKEDFGDPNELLGYTGGALNKLAEYGPSKVDPSQYLPDTQIPAYQHSQIGNLPNVQGRVPNFNVQGNIPEFDSTQFDIYKDPSYEWRKEEMLRGVDRTSGATGKITSGNRIDEIMARTGDMASQEYGAARGRMVQDYGIRRENEASQYGRDVYGYGQDRANALTRYGFDTDAYNRAYSRDQDQYGRDLTGYNADVARESGMYSRGVGEYGIYQGIEGDYLNRLASLSNIGQTATARTGDLGANYATNAGNAITAAGNAQAAGELGQANAWGGLVSDLGYIAGRELNNRPPPPPSNLNYSPAPQTSYQDFYW